MFDLAARIFLESWFVLCQMAPYLLFGFLVAGVLSICVSPEWVERHLGPHALSSVWKASLLGIPLPVCSCGVIPVAASMRRHGASRAATTAFLLSTPQTGIDSIAATYALLGPVFAAFRPVAALLSGFLGGILVLLFGESKSDRDADAAAPPTCREACCNGDRSQHVLLRALRYGLVTLPRDVGVALIVGVVIGGAMSALSPTPDRWHAYLGGGIFSILLLMAAGVPVYVCATASVPIAAGFMHMGASPGAALAFLITGASTNPATFTTVWKVLGRRTALVYLTTVALSAVGCGLLLDRVASFVPMGVPDVYAHHHEMSAGDWFSTFSAIALLAVLGYAYFAAWHEHAEAHAHQHPAHAAHPAVSLPATGATGQPGPESVVLAIAGMTCDHCAERVRHALAECPGVRSVEINVDRGRAVVNGAGLDPELLSSTVSELGYTVHS